MTSPLTINPYPNARVGAPKGYKPLSHPSYQVAQKAKSLLDKPIGYEEKFQLDGINYFARLEPHYHPLDYDKGPRGWHKGCTIYVENANNTDSLPPVNSIPTPSTFKNPDEGNLSLYDKIDNFLSRFLK